VIELLNHAKRPLLYLGHGIRLDHSIAEAKQLYNALQIPVVTSWNGVDLIAEDHPLYVGRPGSVGHRHANLIQHKADLVITIGTRLNLIATGYNYDSFLEHATHVMVDIDPAEMEKKSIHPQVKIAASAHSFLTELLQRLDEVHIPGDVRESWLAECRRIKAAYPVRIPEQAARDGYVSNYNLISEISHQMTGNDIYQFTSSGTTVDIAMKVFEIKEGQRAFLTKGLAAMGYDIPACIGSAVAMQNRQTASEAGTADAGVSGRSTGQVVCVTGDGSAAMNLQELEVIARRQLPIKLFISDNSGYSMIYGSQNGNFHRLTGADRASGLTLPNMAAVAGAFGIHAVEIPNEDHLQAQIAEVLEYPGPVVCRVHTDIEQKILPKQASYMREDGQMASRPLYDMAPLVDPEELQKVLEDKE
jgi:acetolactate synthase-1/2/3 large subunit